LKLAIGLMGGEPVLKEEAVVISLVISVNALIMVYKIIIP
jgi:hypothetical protein